LLEKVPGFYVPGLFDAELEALAAQDLEEALKTLAPVDKPQPGASEMNTPMTPAEPAVVPVRNSANTSQCDANAIAHNWLEQLDGAIEKRNALEFVNLFAPQVSVTAMVKNNEGNYSQLSYSRSELAKSTFSSLGQLTQFSTRRPSIHAQLTPDSSPSKCDRIDMDSVVIESGTRAGLSYRLESLETYTLARLGSNWLAVKAATKQR
jgi:hypothetical protein